VTNLTNPVITAIATGTLMTASDINDIGANLNALDTAIDAAGTQYAIVTPASSIDPGSSYTAMQVDNVQTFDGSDISNSDSALSWLTLDSANDQVDLTAGRYRFLMVFRAGESSGGDSSGAYRIRDVTNSADVLQRDIRVESETSTDNPLIGVSPVLYEFTDAVSIEMQAQQDSTSRTWNTTYELVIERLGD